ncbi:cytochrome c oxidase subunit II [Paracoccus sp. TK19116]|uniref:Cytochrome aa3 subunit 2 n=1 Tax=Paracoccus albicereus TaxID=2922394 RepID=A0ABT1MT09_9RHOB|nr:cytochrome c oxidase subunit II [Paracoccus albicereus]MCQ0970473.1 cytochrome c oxidase subunit II [Paracoccus albicereus]
MKIGIALALTVVLASCEGRQSVLSPAGRDAEVLANLFWWMLGGAVVLWLFVNGLMLYFSRIRRKRHSLRVAQWFIFMCGVVLPTTVLAGLLIFALREMPQQREPGEGLTLRVTGESWWWRVEYWPDGADEPVTTANEIRLPAGSRSEIELAANGVIHSFWIPALGGKTDMIPGRVNRMSLEPTAPGTYRGQCAEFCGLSHAHMALEAVVMAPEEFERWLGAEARDARAPEGAEAKRGKQLFLSQGCGGCHTVRGTPATARVGPDLTHLGGRKSLAAGMLPMDRQSLVGWLSAPESIKPGVNMPGYDHLPPADLQALAAYLEGLT